MKYETLHYKLSKIWGSDDPRPAPTFLTFTKVDRTERKLFGIVMSYDQNKKHLFVRELEVFSDGSVSDEGHIKSIRAESIRSIILDDELHEIVHGVFTEYSVRWKEDGTDYEQRFMAASEEEVKQLWKRKNHKRAMPRGHTITIPQIKSDGALTWVGGKCHTDKGKYEHIKKTLFFTPMGCATPEKLCIITKGCDRDSIVLKHYGEQP